MSKECVVHSHGERPDPLFQTALTAAGEVLTGVNASSLSHYAGAAFVREIERTNVEAGGVTFTMSLSMQGGEAQAADWIYAASFAARSNSVYLAGYSGRVVLVDENGKGVRLYDIGSVPRRIVDTGDDLYLPAGYANKKPY